MRMTQLSPNHQTPNHKPSKPTKEQLQNELNFYLAEKTLMILQEKELNSQDEFN
ncbi:hypothetical protein QT711_10480 [Sporosarcina saromensis]|uniref:Fur-regulated basic protein A n=1 Tax=Sporosarcina saromensis TaxID=359365 RepID=A0ABU4G9F9_9BACL|nr:hypothetical protein [Sporosarcina saromensis]MDW0113614.1 hypothetical protein [Sporosarcina saromensis]